jgi:uncharacterized protein HemY
MIDWIRSVAIGTFQFLLSPFRALLELVQWVALTLAPEGSQKEGEDEPRPLWLRMLLFPVNVITGFAVVVWQVVAYPLQGWFQDRRRQRQLLWGIPAVVVSIFFASVLADRRSTYELLKIQYFKTFEETEAKKEYGAARLLAYRLIRNGVRAAPEAAFRYCKLLAADNDIERANAVIETLAPNDAPGYAPAHAQRAIAHAGMLARGVNPKNVLDPLLWHLNQSNDRKDEKLALAWATYYQATQQFPEAVRHLAIAAQANSEHWFSIANIMVARGDNQSAREALRYAEEEYRRKVGDDPLSLPSRILLLQAQIRLRRFEEAQQTLNAGLGFYPDSPELKQAQGTLEGAKLIVMQESDQPEEKLFEQAMLVLTYPDQQEVALDRMVNMYPKMGPTNRQKIRDILEQKAVENPSKALVQLSLSTLAIIDKRTDDAIALLEKTIELDDRIHIAKNNLAWLLAEREPPDMERAIQLAEDAVADVPNSPNYRDTLGMILLKKGDVEKAITELERALPNMPENERQPLYDRLATAYAAIGNASLAETYRSKLTAKPKLPKP